MSLNNGKSVSGSLVEETNDSFSIQPLAGSVQVVKKANVNKHHIAKTSLMPEGLIDHLNAEQVANLFAYLRTLK